ncbi:probable cytochrome P450 313a4 [Rhagoletis pomonella]|uniref:probable cytochrome P450 313a4 n=1 Tax=Rhagoletis pomonella TaxID=28610 RepID=UPI00177AA70E|nr:probable cytochrome P450 313a4 [Rhagoletis pomonella]
MEKNEINKILKVVGLTEKLDILEAFRTEEQKFGQTFFSWLGPYPFLVVADPQIAQEILTSPHCVNKSFIYNALDDGTGKGLFSLSNPKWTTHRRLLNPAFGHKVLLNFIPTFNEEAKKLLKNLEVHLMDEIDLTSVLQNFTLKVATQTTMGDTIFCDGSKDFHEGVLSCYKCVQESMTQMCFSPWLNFKAFRWLWKNYSAYAEAKLEIRNCIRKVSFETMKVKLKVLLFLVFVK